ncbi:MAG: LysE family translocator, partial [Pseudomonadota bacterium]
TILAASSTTYIAIKWAGVAYMAWLGASQLRSAHQMVQEDLAENLPVATIDKRSFYTGFFVGVLNPKAVLFYIAFLAQFLDPTHALRPQFIILMITSTVIVVVVLGTYALCALRVRRLFESLKARKRMGYAGGSFLLGGSLFLASN